MRRTRASLKGGAEPSTSPAPSTRRTRSQKASSPSALYKGSAVPAATIANSTDTEEYSDNEIRTAKEGGADKSTLKEVVIVKMATRPAKRALKSKPNSTSVTSADSITRDTSMEMEYDTPSTSVSTTPGASTLSGRKFATAGPSAKALGKRKVGNFLSSEPDDFDSDDDGGNSKTRAGPSTKALGKRKVGNFLSNEPDDFESDDDSGNKKTRAARKSTIAADAALAKALQEEEYQASPRGRKLTSSDMDFDEDSDNDDLTGLSSLSSPEEDSSSPPSKRRAVGKGKAVAVPRGKAATAWKNRVTVALKRKKPKNSATEKRRSMLDSKRWTFLTNHDKAYLSVAGPLKCCGRLDKRYGTWGFLHDYENFNYFKALSEEEKGPEKEDILARRREKERLYALLDLEPYRHLDPDQNLTREIRNRIQLEMSHPKLRKIWIDLKSVPIIKPVPGPQPSSITRTLKSFQLEGVDWMIKQERSSYKGGLLGDEMGMGKTIQAVSLIMSDYPAKEPTLVVVPPVALMQWSNEIREYTNGKLKVLVYHGTNSKSKNLSVKELKKYDVIMVSYNSLESLHRKETKGWSRGEHIVKEKSTLHAINYHRLILDEAHSIKSRTTGVAKACFVLKGKYKWCLSGTPVQNRIGEFFSLLRFLEIRPFADYFCRSCDCEQIHWSLDDDHMCTHCQHSGPEHVSVFNQELLNPITGDDPKMKEEGLERLHLLTSRVMLRRLKKDNTSAMELPPKEIYIHNEFFSEIERDFSTSIMTNSTREFDTYVSRGVMLNNYANIFGLIMQMRQVANHPDLLLKKNTEGSQNVLVCNICDEPAEEAIRSRCHHDFCRSCVKSYVRSHEGSDDPDCPRCHIPLSIDFDQPEVEQDEELVKKNSIINRIKMENWTSSTKIEMLLYDLYQLRSKKQRLKSIVFSQFTSMLQLIEWRLRRAGFSTVMLDGSMTPAQRQRSIEYFMNNADVEVFLVSLKAGGVALNLTEASRVFIVDPWWNPAAEWQSADRCHRIGQKRPCVITRLCIEDSVESRMVLLQEKKAAMIAGTVNNDKVAMDKLTPQDLQFLFRGT